ncbi:MAG: T9SS type A sorting domain-containing protein, partial [Bacteroidales bacterium]|nr:T9SS type A sorting domain-containing protein [Bacteroidales bacterium]
PNNGNFTISITPDHVGEQIAITDLNGRTILVRKIESENTEISLGKIAAGIYFARIGENKLKFVVE